MTRRLWALAGAAVAVRAISAATLAVVAPDGARNLRMSRLILEGAWTESLTIYPLTHPLYPILAALGEAVTGAALFSGLAVSVVLGGLSVIPLYHLARRAWNERVATITAILYIFLPKVVELHGDAMLEGTFFFFFFSAMALAVSAVDLKSWERAAMAGASIACAWLTRPEGVYLVPLLFLAAALRPTRFALATVPIALAVAGVLAMPYQGFIKAQTGKYGVSANPLSVGMLGLFSGSTSATGYSVTDRTAEEFKEYDDIRRFGRFGGPVVSLAKETSGNLFHALVPFMLIGLFALRRSETRWRDASFLFAGIVGYYLPTTLAFLAGTPFSHRYILVPCILMLPLAALGLIQAAAWMRHRHALAVLLVALCVAMAIRDVRPRRADKIGIKLAGLALRQRLGDNARILSPSRQVEFYARGEFVDLPAGATFDDIRKLIAGKPKIHAIALHVSDFRNLEPGLQEKLDRAFEQLGSYPPEGGRNAARVYLTP